MMNRGSFRFLLAWAALAATTACFAADAEPKNPSSSTYIVPARPPIGVPAQGITSARSVTVQVEKSPEVADSIIAWDATRKEATVKAGTVEAPFAFNLTNASSSEVTINSVSTSCGCTVAQLPAQPWVLKPGEQGTIHVTMNVVGKTDAVTKTVTINSNKGSRILIVTTTVLPPSAAEAMADREKRQKIALGNRQNVFKGDCARCHAEPAVGLMGAELYGVACGICHEAEHRAAMVQDLHALPVETSAEFWRFWIETGKPGTLMPAFAQTQEGILTRDQIDSLVQYLTETIPSKPGVLAPASQSAIR